MTIKLFFKRSTKWSIKFCLKWFSFRSSMMINKFCNVFFAQVAWHLSSPYTGWPKKHRNSRFLGLYSDQQLSFFTLLDRASFPHYNNTKIIKFGWELFYFMSNFLWTVIFGICHSFVIKGSSVPTGGAGGADCPPLTSDKQKKKKKKRERKEKEKEGERREKKGRFFFLLVSSYLSKMLRATRYVR